MAEGFEESETNNNSNNCEGAVMIGTVMPSLASSLNFGSIKKELESACVTSKIHLSPSSDHDDRNRSPELQKRCVKEVSPVLFLTILSNMNVSLYHNNETL